MLYAIMMSVANNVLGGMAGYQAIILSGKALKRI